MECWIKKEGERTRREGKKVREGYMKIRIEDKLWVWDERRAEGMEGKRSKRGWEG